MIKCNVCKKCNRKGLPSVMKGSAYCEMMRGTISDSRASAWGMIRNRISYLFRKVV